MIKIKYLYIINHRTGVPAEGATPRLLGVHPPLPAHQEYVAKAAHMKAA